MVGVCFVCEIVCVVDDAGILVSIVVSIPACHAGDPGSIPGREALLFATTPIVDCHYCTNQTVYVSCRTRVRGLSRLLGQAIKTIALTHTETINEQSSLPAMDGILLCPSHLCRAVWMLPRTDIYLSTITST